MALCGSCATIGRAARGRCRFNHLNCRYQPYCCCQLVLSNRHKLDRVLVMGLTAEASIGVQIALLPVTVFMLAILLDGAWALLTTYFRHVLVVRGRPRDRLI